MTCALMIGCYVAAIICLGLFWYFSWNNNLVEAVGQLVFGCFAGCFILGASSFIGNLASYPLTKSATLWGLTACLSLLYGSCFCLGFGYSLKVSEVCQTGFTEAVGQISMVLGGLGVIGLIFYFINERPVKQRPFKS